MLFRSQRLTELTERLERAGAEEATEPDPAERDRLAAAARASRSVETDARLALRTAEERVRSLAGRADSLSRAVTHEHFHLNNAYMKGQNLFQLYQLILFLAFQSLEESWKKIMVVE